MDYEKAYKNAIKIARELKEQHRQVILAIFPELTESEDEKIRKEIISIVKSYRESCITEGNHRFKECLTWLEKQGETFTKKDVDDAWLQGMCDAKQELEKQDIPKDYRSIDPYFLKPIDIDTINPKFKVGDVMRTLQEAADNIRSGLPVVVSIDDQYYHCNNQLIAIKEQNDYEYPPMNRMQKPTDKVEPKFKVGDWIFSPAWGTAHIIGTGVIGVNDSDFLLEYIDGKKEYTPSEYVNSAFDKWNIKDAKDGDVLVAKGNYFQEYIFIYSKMTEDDVISTHCGYDVIRNASDKTMSRFGRVEDFHFVCPATKEQRDLLFQKMREEGYEWDDNNKELKKFENL